MNTAVGILRVAETRCKGESFFEAGMVGYCAYLMESGVFVVEFVENAPVIVFNALHIPYG